jgi:hypothetical protein
MARPHRAPQGWGAILPMVAVFGVGRATFEGPTKGLFADYFGTEQVGALRRTAAPPCHRPSTSHQTVPPLASEVTLQPDPRRGQAAPAYANISMQYGLAGAVGFVPCAGVGAIRRGRRLPSTRSIRRDLHRDLAAIRCPD